MVGKLINTIFCVTKKDFLRRCSYPGRYSQETPESGYEPLYNSRDFESDSLRRAPILQISSSIDDTELEIVTCNQLSLFN